VIDSTKWV